MSNPCQHKRRLADLKTGYDRCECGKEFLPGMFTEVQRMKLPKVEYVESFPDKSDAARKFAPPLTRAQLETLWSCPYERPGKFDVRHRPKTLAGLGLLEEDPCGPGWFRVTPAGAAVVQTWADFGFKKPPSWP